MTYFRKIYFYLVSVSVLLKIQRPRSQSISSPHSTPKRAREDPVNEVEQSEAPSSDEYCKLYNELCKTRVLIGLEECVIRV